MEAYGCELPPTFWRLPARVRDLSPIHADYPENIECLRYLVHICDDLGKKDQVHEYVVKLRKAERAQEQMGPPGAQTQMGAPAEHRGPHEHGGGMPYGGDE